MNLTGRAMTERFSFVALGDMPYRRSDRERFATLVQHINGLGPAFSVHVGDLKKAKSKCSGKRYRRRLACFGQFEHPVIYTPGDNDWADCHKRKAGGFNSLERLAKVRRLFFPTRASLGDRPMTLDRQGDSADFPDLVENSRWNYGGFLFATFHVTGGNNNLGRGPATDAEYKGRNRGNVAWMDETFTCS